MNSYRRWNSFQQTVLFPFCFFFSQPCALSPHKPHLPTISSDVFSSLLTLASKLMLTNLLRANWIVSHPSNQESMPIVSFSPFASRGRDWAFQVDPADAPPPCLQHPLSSCRSLFFFSSLLYPAHKARHNAIEKYISTPVWQLRQYRWPRNGEKRRKNRAKKNPKCYCS